MSVPAPGILTVFNDIKSLPSHPRIRAEWDVLHLADGSIVFASIMGRHLRLREPTESIRTLLGLLDGRRSLEEIFTFGFGKPLSPSERKSLAESIAKLVGAGVVEENRTPSRPSWVDDRLFARFALELRHFSMFARPDLDEYTMF